VLPFFGAATGSLVLPESYYDFSNVFSEEDAGILV
jgi:hypothetical protein